jgi:hypothetical protein
MTVRFWADRGLGLIGSVTGLLVTVLFLAFAVQVMLGLYATSTLRAVLHDAASRGADGLPPPGRIDHLEAEARRSLGRMGERTTVELEVEDTDGDGLGDVVVGRAVTQPPRVVPPSIGGMVGFEEVQAGVRVRIERPR